MENNIDRKENGRIATRLAVFVIMSTLLPGLVYYRDVFAPESVSNVQCISTTALVKSFSWKSRSSLAIVLENVSWKMQADVSCYSRQIFPIMQTSNSEFAVWAVAFGLVCSALDFFAIVFAAIALIIKLTESWNFK
jgi:hypothetical protein